MMRLLDTVYRVEAEWDGNLLPFGEKGAERRAKIIQEASSLQVHWDTKTQKYIFADGTSLPDLEKKQYRREIWRPMVAGLDLLEVIMERQGPRWVSIWVVEAYSVGATLPIASLKVVNVKAKDESLVTFNTGGREKRRPISATAEFQTGTSGTRSTWKLVEFEEGDEIQVELIVDDQSRWSPVLKP
jgi:hypothetical protein